MEPGSLQLVLESFPVAGYSGDDHESKDGNPGKPFGRVFESPHEIVPEEIRPGLPSERSE